MSAPVATFDNVRAALETAGCGPQEQSGELRARCPAHGGDSPSLSVSRGANGRALITCHSKGCSYGDVLSNLGLGKKDSAPGVGRRKTPTRKPDHVFQYRDASGVVLTEMVRWDRRSGEDALFWEGRQKIVRPRTKGRLRGLPKGTKYPLFQLPDLLSRHAAPVLIVEGEKTVLAAAKKLDRGVVVTSAFGAGGASKTDWAPLAERECVLWPDAGIAGAAYAADVARFLPGVRVVDVSGLPEGWDLADEPPAGLDVQKRFKAAQTVAVQAGGLVAAGKSRLGLAQALRELNIDARWNVRARRVEHRLQDAQWQAADDRMTSDIRAKIGELFHVERRGGDSPLSFGKLTYYDLLDAIVHHRQEDPFLLWVESRPPWDGEPRIDNLLASLFGAADDDLSKWASRYIGIGALQRAFQPGAKLDQVPVLIGSQGIGKSAFVSAWLPPEYPEWHGDALDLSSRNKEQAEALSGRVVVEMSEMAGLARADIESLKSFVTRRDDGQHRGAYQRASESAPRRCIFVGTSNDDECLPNDPTGNRRFVPVPLIRGSHVEPSADRDRDQWWAEALHRYKAGVRASLPRDLMPQAAEAAEQHRRADSLEDDVRKVLIGDEVKEISLTELAEKLGFDLPDMQRQRRIGAALKACGFEKGRKKGLRMWQRHGARP